MDDSFTLPAWARRALLGAGLFVLGGLIAFGYSWRPLHGSLTWKVAALEEKLDARNLKNLKLSDELARLRSQDAGRVDSAALENATKSLEKAESALAQAEKDLARSERKRKDAGASARTWRKRYEHLRDDTSRSPAAASPTPVSPPGPEPAILGGGNGPIGGTP